jgi:hypothetical protein
MKYPVFPNQSLSHGHFAKMHLPLNMACFQKSLDLLKMDLDAEPQ